MVAHRAEAGCGLGDSDRDGERGPLSTVKLCGCCRAKEDVLSHGQKEVLGKKPRFKRD